MLKNTLTTTTKRCAAKRSRRNSHHATSAYTYHMLNTGDGVNKRPHTYKYSGYILVYTQCLDVKKENLTPGTADISTSVFELLVRLIVFPSPAAANPKSTLVRSRYTPFKKGSGRGSITRIENCRFVLGNRVAWRCHVDLNLTCYATNLRQ